MNVVVDWALLMAGAVLALPCLVFSVQCLLACLSFRRARVPATDRPSLAVLMPAHDEAQIIEATLAALLPQLDEGDRLVVVADNCSDNTAQLSRQASSGVAGVEVIERTDDRRRGKGYALVHGLEHLEQDPREVVIVLDADCTVEAGALSLLAEDAVRRNGPVQADYVLSLPSEPSSKSMISALAFIVKNRVRPLGMDTLGQPCALTGTGMAFPFEVLKKAPPTEGHLVEDMVMGIDLALMGHAPRLCPQAHVLSGLPNGDQAAQGQRTRWEHGHIATIKEHLPRLLAGFFKTGQLGLLAMGLDLLVPPLALLVLLTTAHFSISLGWWLLGGTPWALLISAAGFAGVGISVLGAWLRFARTTLPLLSLLSIPFYILWKVPMYVTLALRGRQRTWERTDRDS